jgi:hypothetical protein
MILLHTTIYKPTAKILRAGAVKSAAAHLVGGFRPHRRPVEAFFGNRAACPPASGVIVRPGRAPAALGVGVDRGQPRHFRRCSSSRWRWHLTLEGRPSSWRSTLRPSSWPRRPDRGADGRAAPILLTVFCGRRIAVLLDPGGSGEVAAGGVVDRPPWGGLDNREGGPPKVGCPGR